MKYKTTRKAIVNGSINIRSAGYCDLQHLLRNHEPIAYTCGVYGWNFDVYEVYGLTICTGYRGMPGSRLDGIQKYEKQAQHLAYDYKSSAEWDENRKKTERLLQDFCVKNGGHVYEWERGEN